MGVIADHIEALVVIQDRTTTQIAVPDFAKLTLPEARAILHTACNSTPLAWNLPSLRTFLASVARQPAASGARPWPVPGAHSPREGATVPGRRGTAGSGLSARLWPPRPSESGGRGR